MCVKIHYYIFLNIPKVNQNQSITAVLQHKWHKKGSFIKLIQSPRKLSSVIKDINICRGGLGSNHAYILNDEISNK
jgi:hypothetical protein